MGERERDGGKGGREERKEGEREGGREGAKGKEEGRSVID